MNFWQSLHGFVEVELTGADYLTTLKKAGEQGIALYAVTVQSELTVRFRIQREDYEALQALCLKRGDQLRCVHKAGLFWFVCRSMSRPVLVLSVLLILALSAFLPTRILFVQVTGNQRVESARILEAAEEKGIRFFTPRRSIRSEQIKNAMLSTIPELKWVGVNTSGCVARISVQERSLLPDAEDTQLCSIIAGVDGVILSCTAQQGNLLCSPGQAVQKGEVLISCYTDCGLCIQAVRAKGEVYAQTGRFLTAAAPAEYSEIESVKPGKKRCSLLLGKKRFNFWNNSGIWDSTCGRIYEEYYLTLPGNLRLPIGVAVDTLLNYELSVREESQEALLRQFSERYVLEHMAAGEIISKQEHFTQENGTDQLFVQYTCREMIGRPRLEQIGEYHGQTN